MTPDPIGLEGGINLFVYVRGNPLRWIDRRGLFWEYHISTGALWHFRERSDGTVEPGEYMGEGFSGNGEGLNDPMYQAWENVGPIPEGDWRIGPIKTNKNNTTGAEYPFSMRLTPDPGTWARGGGFIIHGGTYSEGCPIFDEDTRKKIGNSGDKTWRVVR